MGTSIPTSDFLADAAGGDRPEPELRETALGLWRRYYSPDGCTYAEYVSHAALGPLPLVHVTWGRHPETGRRVTARGVIAIGRFACGVLAIGQVSWGLLAIGQLAVGLLAGFGQAATGVVCIGQLALGLWLAAGQFAVAQTAVGQFACGQWALGQFGFGRHVHDTWQRDPAVLDRLRELLLP